MFKKILLATDFSENARVAFPWAAELARSTGSAILLVHALEDDLVATAPVFAGYMHPEVLDLGRYRQEFRKAAEKALKTAAEEFEKEGVAVEPHLVEGGKPSQAIVEAANRLEASLIVISTHGRSGLAHMLIGSTAEKVVRSARCPVMTVHEGDRMTSES